MVDVKTVVVSVVAVLSVFLQSGIRAQPTISSSSEDDSCSHMEEELELQVEEVTRLKWALEIERQTIKTLENVSSSQLIENQRLTLKLENKQQLIETLENASITHSEENQRLTLELENKQQMIETLENTSITHSKENQRFTLKLENKQQMIETLENASITHLEETKRFTLELESKQQMIETLENTSITHSKENQRLTLKLENKQQLIEALEYSFIAHWKEKKRLTLELENKQQMIEKLENASITLSEENERLTLELENKQQEIETLKNVSYSQFQVNHRLNLENGTHRQRTQPATATLIGSFDHSLSHHGITKGEDKIYVLKQGPNRIKVYEDLIGFRFITDITLSGSNLPYDIVYSNKSKSVYISDIRGGCIWVMTTGDHRVTKWLNILTFQNVLSLSNEGHLLVLRQSQSFSQDSLEIYSLNATLNRRLQLPQDIKVPLHVIQTSTGNFIISHQLNSSSGPYVISQLTNDGQLINRFIPRNQSETLSRPEHLSLDSANNRLFVTDYHSNRVILFDSVDLTWSQVLLSRETNGISQPWKLFYDASKKHLFVAQYNTNVTVYEIN